MDTQEVAGVEQEQTKIVWLIKGIAKRRITLEAAELQPGALSPRLIRWMGSAPKEFFSTVIPVLPKVTRFLFFCSMLFLN